ncbi:MAG: site-2 protease family protein [Ruminococcaceae bacterium]|nr:site-2 protease family protein [Oscillospiraceae bacterium]
MITINLWYILLALFIFGILIFIHELGHYLAARRFGVTIREFSIGMGPKLFTHVSEKTGTAYSIRLFPIGGFVAMEGEDEKSDDENAFHKKPVWQRIIITAAGAFMNVVVGILVMGVLVASQDGLGSNTISLLPENENGINYAYEGGLRVGDEFYAVEGTRVHIINETFYEIMRKGIEPIDITVIRDGEKITFEDVVFPTVEEQGIILGTIDFKVDYEEKTVLNVIKHAFFRSTSTIKTIWESLIDLITGRYGIQSVSGPIGITQTLGEAAKQGIDDLVNLAVLISMNLGVMNLLPLPALDGGRLLFQIVELVRGKPLSQNIEGAIHFAGLVLLMILMVLIAVKDVIGLF